MDVEQYLSAEGGFSLLEQESHRIRDALKHCAAALGVSDLFEIGVSLERILEIVTALSPNAVDVRNKRNLEENKNYFRDHTKRLQQLEACLLKERLSPNDVRVYLSEKTLTRYKTEVMGNGLADLHFLPPCGELLRSPCVITLRHVTTCSVNFIHAAHSCRSQRDWDIARAADQSVEFSSVQVKPERLLRLKSPHLESMMARFGALFSRVGVPDLHQEQIARLLRWET